LDFLDNLEQNYLNTEIASENKIAEILEIKSGSPSAADNYIANILNNNIGTEIKYSQIDPSSNDNPAVLSASGSYVTELFSNNH
jgi:hypothetical protein